MLTTFLRDANGQFPEHEEDDTVCVTVKDKNGEVMHLMLRNGTRVRSAGPEPQNTDTQ